MEVKKETICSLALVLLLFLASQEKAPLGVEAKVCKSPSIGFKGLCFSDTNCAHVCINEGYGSGNCHGIRRRCICRKNC